MGYKTVDIEGKRFVLVEESEFRRMAGRARRPRKADEAPPLPTPDAEGYVSALPFVRASIARDIVKEREALGLSQQELAKRAGIWQETLCRLEKGQHSPTVRTVEKIERALNAAAQRKARQAKRK